MQEVRLYDPERRPADWTDLLQPGQYAVFLSDIHTDIEQTPAGRYLQGLDQSTCLVFDSLPEVEAYCEERVQRSLRARCDIYDHAGKSKPPMLTYVNKAQLKAPRKFAHWGLLLVAASIVCFWLEWRRGSGLGLALIIGINLLFAGLRLFYWGAGSSEKRRSRREH